MIIPDNIFMTYDIKCLVEDVAKKYPHISFPKWIDGLDGIDINTGDKLVGLNLSGFHTGFYEWEYTDVEGNRYLESDIKERKSKRKGK